MLINLAAPIHVFVFRARLIRVIDGDTIDVHIDQGLHVFREERLRLLKINTPETKGRTKEAGKAATNFVLNWMTQTGSGEWPLLLKTEKSDVFGRFLSHVWSVETGRYLNYDIWEAGHAVEWTKK